MSFAQFEAGKATNKVMNVSSDFSSFVIKETGKKFWSTKDKGQQPFEYTAGVGGVITGWDQGCLGMKLNEVRKLNIPAEEGGHAALSYPARPTAFWP